MQAYQPQSLQDYSSYFFSMQPLRLRVAAATSQLPCTPPLCHSPELLLASGSLNFFRAAYAVKFANIGLPTTACFMPLPGRDPPAPVTQHSSRCSNSLGQLQTNEGFCAAPDATCKQLFARWEQMGPAQRPCLSAGSSRIITHPSSWHRRHRPAAPAALCLPPLQLPQGRRLVAAAPAAGQGRE